MHQINTYWQIILWLTVGLGFNWWTHGLWNLTTLLLILPGFFVVALTMIPTGLVSYLVAKREEPGRR